MKNVEEHTERKEEVLDALAAFIKETAKGPANPEAYAALPGVAETFLKWN